MRLLLLNAVYFKGLWPVRFDSAVTARLPFFVARADSIMVPTMQRTANGSWWDPYKAWV
ncbi:MAG: serpin family protein [Longimicrobiales bacterium]